MNHGLEPITPDEAIELYLTEKRLEFADATLRSHRSRLRHLRRLCDQEDVTTLNPLARRGLHRYRIWRRADGDLSPASEKTQMDTIRVLTDFCETIDAVKPDLSTKVFSPHLGGVDNMRDVMVEKQDAEAIFEYLRT